MRTTVVATLLLLASSSGTPGLGARDRWSLLDEYDRDTPAAGYPYHAMGGDRGFVHDSDVRFTWNGDSRYTATAWRNTTGGAWTWGGMWYSLLRIDRDGVALDFDAVFGPHVRPAYQGRVVGIEVVVDGAKSPSANTQMILKVEARNRSGPLGFPFPFVLDQLYARSYPYTWYIDLESARLGEIKNLTWLLDHALSGDQVQIERVRLKVRVPDLPVADEAFLWSYAWLMANYDPDTGMVQDRSNYEGRTMEHVSATGKAAKAVAYAALKGMTDAAVARTVISRIASTLISTVPRGPRGVNALWPHFTRQGGRQALETSEWASGDTAYAALDVMAALEMIGGPRAQIDQLQSFLSGINWIALLLPDNTISHGYGPDGSLKPQGWDAFGMETMGVNWAFASARHSLASMAAPPSYNGSGFIDNAPYPMVMCCLDRWGNDWDAYRRQMADRQIGWYSNRPLRNPYLAGLFGLSAAEIPEADDPTLPGDSKYVAYGVGGVVPAQDGNGEVIVLHYAGMISDIRPEQAALAWVTLREQGVVSPLNNMESMRVDKRSGRRTVNRLKGSWNLALQAEGWALSDPRVREALRQAVLRNDYLAAGHWQLRGGVWNQFFAVDLRETPLVGDLNGDGMTDILTFTRDNPLAFGDVYVALSDGTRFGPTTKWHDFFAIRPTEVILIGDFDGDGKDDIGTWLTDLKQVYVARSLGTAMGPSELWLDPVGGDPGDWIQAADADGDGKADLVVFQRRIGKVDVALSTGSGFGAPARWHDFFAVSTQERPAVGDVNGDGKADIITFATDSPTAYGDVYVALSTGTRFGDNQKWHDFFAIHPEELVLVGDEDGDRKADFFTVLPQPFNQVYLVRSLGHAMSPNVLYATLDSDRDPGDKLFVGDADGDGRADIIRFAQVQGKVFVRLNPIPRDDLRADREGRPAAASPEALRYTHEVGEPPRARSAGDEP